MVSPLQVAFEVVPQPLAGAAMIALALWLLYLNMASRLHQALALFLVLRGFVNLVFPFVARGEFGNLPERLFPYFSIATFFSALYLVMIYRQLFLSLPHHRLVPFGLLAGALFFEGLYIADHSLYGTLDDQGPMYVFDPLRGVSYLLIALVFAADFLRAEEGPRRRAVYLGSMAFSLDAVFGLVDWPNGEVFPGPLGPPTTLLRVAYAVQVLVVLALGALLFRGAAAGKDQFTRERSTKYLLLLLLVVITMGLAFVAYYQSRDLATSVYNTSDGLWTLAFPVLLAVAILRHQLFDIEIKIRWTLRQSTIAAIFVAIYFVVSETASQLFSNRIGTILGIVAAGLLVFALAPLQRFAEKVAGAAVPVVDTAAGMTPGQRISAYRDLAYVAWADGKITRDERRILEAARRRFALSADQAHHIEMEFAVVGN